MINVTINGDTHHLDSCLKLNELLLNFSIEISKVAVEYNNEIVPRSKFKCINITDGDNLEIIHFIGGG
ncbi:MAG: sulfur carrier protein ThiS [Emcibacteraceae bacterium]|nr:sulfur carrier protein ThiS [Emcibacteraceae bacterium]